MQARPTKARVSPAVIAVVVGALLLGLLMLVDFGGGARRAADGGRTDRTSPPSASVDSAQAVRATPRGSPLELDPPAQEQGAAGSPDFDDAPSLAEYTVDILPETSPEAWAPSPPPVVPASQTKLVFSPLPPVEPKGKADAPGRAEPAPALAPAPPPSPAPPFDVLPPTRNEAFPAPPADAPNQDTGLIFGGAKPDPKAEPKR